MPDPEWEVCDVTYRVIRGGLFRKGGFCFHVWATGVKGSRPLAESAPFAQDPRIEGGSRREFGDLLDLLRTDGWELTGERGGHWYSVRLRRPLRFSANGADHEATEI